MVQAAWSSQTDPARDLLRKLDKAGHVKGLRAWASSRATAAARRSGKSFARVEPLAWTSLTSLRVLSASA